VRVQHPGRSMGWCGHREDGICVTSGGSDYDLIAEWTDEPEQTGPVRTEVHKTIVPGRYGMVSVGVRSGDELWIDLNSMMTAAELRAAAATMIEIADAREGGAK